MNRRKGYLIAQTVLCCLLAFCLAYATIRMYREGAARKADQPLAPIYTAENVADALIKLSPLFLALVGTTAAGLGLGIRDERLTHPVKSPVLERDLLVAALASPGEAIQKECRLQRCVRWSGMAAFGLCMAPVLIYCTKADHFPAEDLENMILSLTRSVFPWMAAGFFSLVLAGLLEEKSILREVNAARTQLREGKARTKLNVQMRALSRHAHSLRAVFLAAAFIFIVLGVLNGSLKDVLLKAINICTECVGLG